MAADDTADLQITIGAPVDKLARDLARANAQLATSFAAMQAKAQGANDNLGRSFETSAKRITKSLDLSRPIEANRVQMQTLQSVAHRMFDSIAAGQSPMRALEMQAGDLVSVLGEGQGLQGIIGSLAGRLSFLANPVAGATALVGALAAGVVYFGQRTASASDNVASFASWMRRVGLEGDHAADAIEKARKSLEGMSQLKLVGLAAGQQASIADLRKQAQDLPWGTFTDQNDWAKLINPQAVQALQLQLQKQIQELTDKALDGTMSVKELDEAFADLVKQHPVTGGFLTQLQAILDKLQDIQAVVIDPDFARLRNGIDAPRTPGAQPPAAGQANATAEALHDKALADIQVGQFDKAVQSRMDAIRERLLSQGITVDADTLRGQAVEEVQAEGTNSTIDAIVGRVVNRTIAAESGGRDRKNPNSSASGIGQFIDGTFISEFRKVFPEMARGVGDNAILAYKHDSEINKKLIEDYARTNLEYLNSKGLEVSDRSAQLAHFLGQGGAEAILRAAPGTPVSSILGAKQIAANPTILGGGATRDSVLRYAQSRVDGLRVAAGDLTGPEKQARSYDDLVDSIKRSTAAIGAEVPAQQRNNVQLQAAKAYQEALNEAQQRGIPLNDKQKAQLQQLATARAQATVAQNVQAESARKLQDNMDDVRGAAKDALSTFVGDLREGKSLTEALGDALNSLLDKVLDRLEDSVISSLFGAPGTNSTGSIGGSVFGWLGGLFGFRDGGLIPAYADGGMIRGPGTGTSDSILASTGKRLLRVSDQEFIVNAAQTRKHRGLIEAINSGAIDRFATGGIVGGGAGAGTYRAASAPPAINLNTSVTVNASGGTPEQNDDLSKKVSKQVEASLGALVDQRIMRQLRQGGILDGARR